MLVHDGYLYVFGGVHFVKGVVEFLNDLWRMSLVEKVWWRV
jgi:hypothetical protein